MNLKLHSVAVIKYIFFIYIGGRMLQQLLLLSSKNSKKNNEKLASFVDCTVFGWVVAEIFFLPQVEGWQNRSVNLNYRSQSGYCKRKANEPSHFHWRVALVVENDIHISLRVVFLF